MYAIQKLRHYLYGAKFTVYTDHKPLKSLFSSQMKNTRVQRWAIMLSEYNCTIEYIRGKRQKADPLSRLVEQDPSDLTIDEASCENDLLRVGVQVINTDVAPQAIPSISQENSGEQSSESQVDIDQLLDTLVTLPAKEGLRQLQGNDNEVAKIIDSILEKGEGSKFSHEFIEEDNLLYHLANPVRLDPDPRLQLVIPTELTHVILESYHDRCGHMGIDKSYDSIRRRYWWKNMYKDVVKHVKKCLVCNSRKLKRVNPEMQDLPLPNAPFQMVGIDTCGPFPESNSGNLYIITLTCHYSNYPEAYPVPDK